MIINSLRYSSPTNDALLYRLLNSIPCRHTNTHRNHHVGHKILPNGIYTLFSKALDKFEPITGQPKYSNLAELRKVLSKILLVILYHEENGLHNLVGLIQDPTTYTSDYTAAFSQPRKIAIYDASIRDNDKALVCAQK